MPVHLVFVTTCRSDYAPSSWLLRDLADDSRFRFRLFVGGAHLSATCGTVGEIETDGIDIAARIGSLASMDDPAAVAESVGVATGEFARRFAADRPDVVMVYGDRFELLAVASAAVATGSPLAHLCGGDITEGAIDEQVRHALTKFAHLHFPSTALSAKRVVQMGEEPWRVHIVGDPALDGFRRTPGPSLEELSLFIGFAPSRTTLLVTFHPVTLELDELPRQAQALMTSLSRHEGRVIVTAPAPDAGHTIIREQIARLLEACRNVVFVESLGGYRYRGLLEHIGAMVGNSSSGLNEAAAIPLPVVNIGTRQAGRERASNVIDTPPVTEEIDRAIKKALSPAFRASLTSLVNPYGDGKASERIRDVLADLPYRDRLLRKRFVAVAGVGGLATPGPRSRTLGGNFALPEEALFSSLGPAMWFSAGRDALFEIVQKQPRKRGLWLVPEFVCGVVPRTVHAAGATAVPYSLIDPWTPNLSALQSLLVDADGIIIPHYLGLSPDPRVFDLARAAGTCVIEDRCQCPTLPPTPSDLRGDFAIGSLRKWLPLPDGAWCVARRGSAPAPENATRPALSQTRLAAALLRSARDKSEDPAMASRLDQSSAELFGFAEAQALSEAGPFRMSPASEALLRAGIPSSFIEFRLRNQRGLAARLAAAGVPLFEPQPGALFSTPQPLLALPVLCRNRDTLRSRLAAERVYCAVHWLDGDWANQGGMAESWARSVLSLPIDHRVDQHGLDLMGEVVSQCV